jgi:tetratricopeptide (TPR) repeat protein
MGVFSLDLGNFLGQQTGRQEEAETAVRRAVTFFEQLTAKYPKEREYKDRLARSYSALVHLLSDTGKLQEAEQVFPTMVAIDKEFMAGPADTAFLNDLADSLLTGPPQLRDAHLALELVRRAIQQEPRNPEVLDTLGVAYYRTGDYTGAIREIQKSLATSRDRWHPHVTFFLAMAHWKLGNEEKGRKWYAAGSAWMDRDRRLAEDKRLKRFRAEAASLLQLSDHPVGASQKSATEEQCWSLLIEADPEFFRAHLERAVFYAEGQAWAKANADIAQAIKLKADNVRSYYLLALVRLAAHEEPGYRSACADLVEHCSRPEDPERAYWIAWTCALAPGAMRDWDRPIKLAELAFQKGPASGSNGSPSDSKGPESSSSACARTLGAVLYRAGRFADAAKHLHEAYSGWENAPVNESGSTAAYTCFFLALTHHRLGDAAKARHYFDRGTELADHELKEHAMWNRKVTLELLRREAEQALHGTDKR